MDKKPKFKVGDKVIGNNKADKYSITKEGWIGTVTEVHEYCIWVSGKGLIGKRGTEVDIRCFDLYKPAPNYKAVITSDGKITTARYYENEKKVSEAKSVCHEEDEFDFTVGAAISVARAVKGEDNIYVQSSSDNCYYVTSDKEEPKETEWDKFKNGELTFKVYQKDIEKFLDVCTDDNIVWNKILDGKDEKANEYTNWEEWSKYPAVYFFICRSDNRRLTYYKDKCNFSVESIWNPSDPDHNPTKVKTYKGITIDGDTAYVKYEGEEIPFDIVERNGNKLTLVSRNILEFMPFSVSNSNDYAKSDIKNFLHDKFVKRFEPEFINMLTCDGFYLMSGEEVNKYYPERKDKTKKYLSEPHWYWLRTPVYASSNHVRIVNINGSLDFSGSYVSRGLVPACEIFLES